LRFDVVDTGIGMTPQQVQRAFLSFSQADETMSRRFGGTGLGLTISRHLAAMLGGEITVASELNKGSTFSVTIATGPLDGVHLIDAKSCSTNAQAEKTASVALANSPVRLSCRVLLVEDGPDNQRLISFVLRRAGAEVVIAENGQLGVEAAIAAWQQQRPFDVILMDMQMPVLDGYAATSLLRRKGYRHPIVALTAHAMPVDREKCLSAGCDEYVAKPVDRAKLLQLVQRYESERADVDSASPASVTPTKDT
jgi:CheY-like chemotaxis protein